MKLDLLLGLGFVVGILWTTVCPRKMIVWPGRDENVAEMGSNLTPKRLSDLGS